jgi:3'(2'), 5'-bisphosphate nucleotidase
VSIVVGDDLDQFVGANTDDLSSDVALARHIACVAGRHLVDLRLLRTRTEGFDPAQLGKDGDVSANELILSLLRAHRPSDAILSEESVDDLDRLHAERVWIVDPLDGTREYPRPNSSDWAVHIALWTKARSTHSLDGLVAAAVSIPEFGRVYTTDTSRFDNAKVAEASPSRLRVIASASRPQPEAELVASELDAELIRMGSAGAKAMALLRDEADIYVHSGGQYEWDSAAPVAVVQAHDWSAVRLDGSPLQYNQRSTFLPDLLICRPNMLDQVLRVLTKVI